MPPEQNFIAPPPPKNYWPFLTLVLFILLIGAVAAAGVAILRPQLVQNILGLTPPPISTEEQPALKMATTTPDETTNWKVYKNEKYRFEMKYPYDDQYCDSDEKLATGHGGAVPPDGRCWWISSSDRDFEVEFNPKTGLDYGYPVLNVSVINEGLATSDLKKYLTNKYGTTPGIDTIEYISMDKHVAVLLKTKVEKYSDDGEAWSVGPKNGRFIIRALVNDGRAYVFIESSNGSDVSRPSDPTITKILSTFRFTPTAS